MQQTHLKTTELGTTGLRITRVGFRRPDRVDPIIAAADLQLTDADAVEIEGGRERRAA
jgi:hypothetical protein